MKPPSLPASYELEFDAIVALVAAHAVHSDVR